MMSDALSPEQTAALLNGMRDGWSRAMNLRFIRASRDEVAADIVIGEQHHQAYGIVHGGVHSGVIETLASVGAAIDASQHGRHVVGLENHTSFLRAERAGTLTAVGKPVIRGKRSQVWEVTITNELGQSVATGRVRVLCLEPEAKLFGAEPSPPKFPESV